MDLNTEMESSSMTNDAAGKAVQLAKDLQREMDVRFANLQSSHLATQNQMKSALESLQFFKPLIANIQEQEKSLSLRGERMQQLENQLLQKERDLRNREEEVRSLGVGLAEAHAYRDELRADQEVKDTEMSGLKADLERTASSLDARDAHVQRVQTELLAKMVEVKVNSEEIRRLQGFLDSSREENKRFLLLQAETAQARAQEQNEMKALTGKITLVEENNRQFQSRLGELQKSHGILQQEFGVKSETLTRLEEDLKRITSERDVSVQTLRAAEARHQAMSNELDEMRRMCGAMEDQWGEERGKLVEELATASNQLKAARRDLQTCTERLETSMAEANLLTTLKVLLKEEGEKRIAEFKLSTQRLQLRYSARLFVAEYHRKMAEAAVEVSSEDAHQERVRHAAEEKALRAELEKVKQEVIKNELHLSQLQMEGIKRWQSVEVSNTSATHQPPDPKPPHEDEPIPGIDNPMVVINVPGPPEAKLNGKPPSNGHKQLAGAAPVKPPNSSISKSEVESMKRAHKEVAAERDLLARRLEQSTRDALSERAQVLQALAATKAEADALRRENKINAAQVGALNERAAGLEKELVELRRSNAFNNLAPNHAATAMRLRELEERSREAERRLRDAVEENVDLRERIDSCEEVEMALKAAKEMLKSAEARVREAVEENSDLRKRIYKW